VKSVRPFAGRMDKTPPSHQQDGDDEEENIYINSSDGLPCDHPVIPEADVEPEVDEESFDDLPTSIIVTNIHPDVFVNEQLKGEMEQLFKAFGQNVTFQWLKSFKRLRVNYENGIAAANARIQLHQYRFGQLVINCYFAQPVTPITNRNLQPPAPHKQFLISPPASPPAGWEPRAEGEPLVNHDLLAALATLTPGESHELLAQTENKPGIYIHAAPAPGPVVTVPACPESPQKVPIAHTRCPDRI